MPPWVRRSLYALAALLATAAALQVYGLVPAGFAVEPLALPANTRAVILLFHGSDGREEPTLVALESEFQRLTTTAPELRVRRYIWSPWSDSKLRTFPNGSRVGAQLGEELATLPQLASIHLLAHSAGAYLLEPLCEAYRARRGSGGARIRMTYLDPIGFRGPLDPKWGARHYGQCADDAEAYINTDDPAPATAAVLQHARTTDVTGDPGRQNFSAGGHRWPVQYYLDRLRSSGVPGLAPRPEQAVVSGG